jgi:hypothetical protein
MKFSLYAFCFFLVLAQVATAFGQRCESSLGGAPFPEEHYICDFYSKRHVYYNQIEICMDRAPFIEYLRTGLTSDGYSGCLTPECLSIQVIKNSTGNITNVIGRIKGGNFPSSWSLDNCQKVQP